MNWNLDPTHSSLEFKVRHMMITNVNGAFNAFDVKVETEGTDFTTAKINVTADVNSVSTNNEQRDGHLKSPDFFDVANHPTMTFVASSVKSTGGDEYAVTGNLSLHGVTKEVTFQVELGGIGKDPWGNEKAGFSISGKINRTDFGLVWNVGLEAGGVLVSEEVKFFGEVQLVKAA